MEAKIKVAISGARGMIGSRLVQEWKDKFKIYPLDKQEFDITDKSKTQEYLSKIDFDVFLHLAAYTNVDKAEEQKDLVYKINVEGTKNIFDVTQNLGKKLIYISTDFVFDSKKENMPFTESSQPNPLGWYGKTKYAGEKIVKDNAMIVRLSYPYGYSPSLKKSFALKIKELLEQGKTLTMITDSLFTPTPITYIIAGLEYLIKNYQPNIYHLVGLKSYSPYEFGLKIAKKYDVNTQLIKPISFQEYIKGRAPRPQWSKIITKHKDLKKMLSSVKIELV